MKKQKNQKQNILVQEGGKKIIVIISRKETKKHIKNINIKLHKLDLTIVFNKGFDFVLLDIFSHFGKISFKNSSADNSFEKLPRLKTFNCPIFCAKRNNLIVQAKKN